MRTSRFTPLYYAAVFVAMLFSSTTAFALATTTTTVVPTPTSSTYGQSVSFVATVTGIVGSPRNSVSLKEGATVLDSQNVNGQMHATMTLSNLSVGTHTLVAVYAGNAGSDPSSSAPFSFVVSKAASTTTMSTPSAITYGSQATFTATVTGPGAVAPTGSVTFSEGGNPLCSGSLALVGGVPTVTCNAAGLGAGGHSIVATYDGDSAYDGSVGATGTQTVNQASTSTALNATPNPSSATESVTFTATVTSGAAGTISGTVDFYDDATKLNASPIALVSGSASYSTSDLSVATHPITAQYSGETNYAGSTSSITSQVVTLAATTTTLNATPNPTTAGVSVTFTATVSSLIAGTISGTVDFYDGATKLNASPVAIAAGQAAYSTSDLSIGSHSITAQYSGDAVFATSTSDPATQVIDLATTTTAVSALPNPADTGASVTLTATVTSSVAGAIGGTADFYDDATKLNDTPVAVTGGQAVYSTSALTAGSHSITAQYLGDSAYAASVSPATSLSIRNVTTTTLSGAPNPVKIGNNVVFTATVTPGSATGTVDLIEGATTIASGAVTGGVATINVSILGVGSHSITAHYSGDSTNAPSDSAAFIQKVTGRPRSDLNADGKSDIVLQNQITSSIAAWIMSANNIQEGKVVANPVPAWRIMATGDFNGDGKSDILLQNNVTGAISDWTMNGAVLASGTVITTTSLNWRIVATRDFNGDGKDDVVVQNTATGAVNIWQMNGPSIVSNTQIGTAPLTTRAVGVGHLGGDAIVFQDTVTGAISRWLVNGTTVTSNVVIDTPPSLDIKVTAVADFNSDGDDDLALQNSATRTVSSWILSPTGTSVVSSGTVATPVAGWLVVGAGDYDADGYGDMLLYNSITNVIAMWQMNGTTIARGWNVGTLPGWRPLGN